MRSHTSPAAAAVRALLIVLPLAAAAHHVGAQSLTCSTIRPGDTAARVATRITGDSRYRHSAKFQIVDPGTGRIVAKAQYDRIQAGWQACVEQVPIAGDPRDALATSWSAINDAGRLNGAAFAIRDPRVVLVLGVGLVVAAVMAWIAFRAYFSDRQRTLEVMTGFGTRFVREFERPLIQPVPDPHRIRSRLRARPERKRLDILLAPSGKGRYPNLSDHKDNVMYDVVRVVRLLRDQSFACGPPYAEGDWVVVPFQFKGWSKQAGGK